MSGDFNGSDRKQLQEIVRETVATRTIVDGIHERLERMDETLVTNDAFKPVQRLVYGIAGFILSSFGGMIIWLLFQRSQ